MLGATNVMLLLESLDDGAELPFRTRPEHWDLVESVLATEESHHRRGNDEEIIGIPLRKYKRG